MNEAYILEFIKQRMAELGFTHYHFESVRVSLDKAIEPTDESNFNYVSHIASTRPKQFSETKFQIMAHGDFYYLVDRNIDSNLTILADNAVFTKKDAEQYSNTNIFQMKEFTGQIFFETTSSPGAIDIEFIKVVPYTPFKN